MKLNSKMIEKNQVDALQSIIFIANGSKIGAFSDSLRAIKRATLRHCVLREAYNVKRACIRYSGTHRCRVELQIDLHIPCILYK